MKQFLLLFIDQFKMVSEYNSGSANPAYIFMFILAVIGFFSLALTIDKLIIIYKTRISENNYANPMLKYLELGEYDKAFIISKKRMLQGSPFALIVFRGLDSYVKSRDFDMLKEAMHEAKLEIYPKLRKRTDYILLLQSIATLIGLAGTIFGLIISFDAVSGENVKDASQVLASGISAAMGTTIGGLFIAIPALTLGSIAKLRINSLISRIEYYTLKVQYIIKRNK
ncbi:MAG: MotA/TolQ/ExbB proton channel family protein [Candidatus Delongbacteria bacterium]|nr:MotA/TolQ/ExbB proton channel family protein [Candidatus Delongbacteria bacterium]MBN2836609.1 MotA/TolQ/ExbB proton channel family protein [Candidatus Delongbacteria bacterium]